MAAGLQVGARAGGGSPGWCVRVLADRGAVGGFGTGTTIGRASQDGTGVTDQLVTVAKGPVGVAVSGSSIYWANTFDLTTSAIGRANVNGIGAVPALIPQGDNRFPCGLAVQGTYI